MEMKPKYDPREVEAGRYEEWVKNGYFKPSEDKSKEHIQLLSRHQM
ncbi:Valyl-tRNA synthetase [Staphylococcus aureus]|uniref:Valyl-tRNA synthetase n=1 Tax=Staphylococcus aureus TaxID=1280 RepID=A0A2X2K192_STAAU|nr:Valyl-tRNA synthetase [Staphylococcus aureus]